MDFDLDDPLADILSGGSDDSFFDDDVLGRKRTPKKTTPLASKKSALFNLDDEIKSSTPAKLVAKEEKNRDVDKGFDSLTKPTEFSNADPNDALVTKREEIRTPAKSNNFNFMDKQKQSSLETLSPLQNIGTHRLEHSGKSMVKRKSSNSLFDDILGSSNTRNSTQIKPPQTSKSQEFDIDALLGNTPVAPTTASANSSIVPANPSVVPAKSSTVPNKPSISSSKISLQTDTKQTEILPKTVSTASKQVTRDTDWLGIFDEKEDEAKNDISDDPGMPAWLVGKSSKPKPKTKEPVPKTPEKKHDTQKETTHEDHLHTDVGKATWKSQAAKEFNSDEEMLKETTSSKRMIDPGNMLVASSEDITQEGAAMYMQQQESQLMIALQLKAQEEKLASMQTRQEESRRIHHQAAVAQQSQLAGMLARQAAHRQQMQSIISSHQERINQRIKALLTTTDHEADVSGGGDGADAVGADGSHADTPRSKEKRQLLQLVQTLQENHDKEIDLMETSYRRQLAISDAASQQAEELTRAATERLARHHADTLERLERGWRERRARDEEAARAARDLHALELADERERRAESVRALRDHHAALMENVKQAVQQERALVHNAADLTNQLAVVTAAVQEGAERGGHLIEAVRALQDDTVRDRQRALEARETHITEMQQQLKRERDTFEKEKTEDRETVKLLENRLRQMTQSVEEETGTMKQKRMEFEFEKATFSKQTDFAKNILKKQEEEIKIIKEDIQKDYQEKLAKIEEEKTKSQKDAAVASKEKISVQNLRLELERLKADLQTQMEDVSEERSRIAQAKQQLQMEEQRMVAKSRDLDLLSKSALEKQSLADRKYSEAEYIQRRYEERVRRLQEHVISLNSREKTIAREKVALSRERLNLHNDKKQLEHKPLCSLCQSMQNQQGNTFPRIDIPNETFLASKYLSMGVSRDYAADAGNADVLEQEMSDFLRREITLRDADGNDAANRAGFRVEQNDITPLAKYKELVDPRLLLLRMDVQQVISNLSRGADPTSPSPSPAPAAAASTSDADHHSPPNEAQ